MGQTLLAHRYGAYVWISVSHENDSVTAVIMDNGESTWKEAGPLKNLSQEQ